MWLLDHIQYYNKEYQTCRICRNDIDQLYLPSGDSLWFVHIKIIIYRYISGHQKIKKPEIGFLGKSSRPRFRIRKPCCKFYIPCK